MADPERHLLVVQHDAVAGPAAASTVLDARRDHLPWRLVDIAAGAAMPAVDGVAGIIVLGGRMGVGDRHENPWIDEELERLREAVEREIPVLGICLGVQLIAAALGGRVEARSTPEIGFRPLVRTDAGRADPVFGGWADGTAALFVHDDEVTEVPVSAQVMLEGSDGLAAWRVGESATYGVQFHPEVSAAHVTTWFAREENRERCARAGVDPDGLIAEAERRDRFHQAAGLALIGRWLDLSVGVTDPAAAPGRRQRG